MTELKERIAEYIIAKALNTVSKAVTTRTTIPILKGILLKTSAKILQNNY